MSKGLAQGPYVAARVGVEPMTLRTKGVDSINVPHMPYYQCALCADITELLLFVCFVINRKVSIDCIAIFVFLNLYNAALSRGHSVVLPVQEPQE